MSTFDDWLFQNGIRIPKNLKDKMEATYVASVDVLSELKKMGGDCMAEVMTNLKLNTIEKAIFNVIISKLDANLNAISPGAQVMTIAPEIISISDNKNGAVNIKWKLIQKPLRNDDTNQLKLEWAQDEKAFDFDHTNDQIINMDRIDLNAVHETRNVVIKNINANIFRLKWRNFSNIKQMKIETDLWDTNHKGQHIQINGNIIAHTATNAWNSIYGKVLCKAPYTYHWQFKIKSFAIYFMFGVATDTNEYNCKDSYLGTKQNNVGYYAAYGDANKAYVYPTGATGEYGMQRFNKNGCVLDMYLDLKHHKLSFKTGGQDTGVVIENLAQEKYRMVVSLYNKQQIELVAFDYN